MGYGDFTHPALYVVHKIPFSEEFGKIFESLESRYIVQAHNLDYSASPPVIFRKEYFGEFASSRWEDYRAYLLDSEIVLIFEGRYWNRIGVHVGELTEEEIVDFFKRRGEPLEETLH
ncbi:MAG: hypothetical protein LBG15_02325 [Dysgonamonadaceae bacterium]|jgi:hypothetical protein|nr:hypothetical protein [Dysgonamonadaceae bacterium]